MFITLSIVYIQISNTCLPEFLNILLYVEANVSLMFIFSGNFEFETGLLRRESFTKSVKNADI